MLLDNTLKRGINGCQLRQSNAKSRFKRESQIGDIVEPFPFMTAIQVVRCKIIVSKSVSAFFKGQRSNQPGNEVRRGVIGQIPARHFIIYQEVFLQPKTIDPFPGPLYFCQ